ncbi:hypothetical protein C3L33_05202, partial [Rhododendron williamsianum]
MSHRYSKNNMDIPLKSLEDPDISFKPNMANKLSRAIRARLVAGGAGSCSRGGFHRVELAIDLDDHRLPQAQFHSGAGVRLFFGGHWISEKPKSDEDGVALWNLVSLSLSLSFFEALSASSLVHKSFEMDPCFDVGDGVAIAKLAMDLFRYVPSVRILELSISHSGPMGCFLVFCNWSEKTDVFAYGIVLLELIAKRRAYDASLDSRRGMNDGNTTYYWALKEYTTHSQSKVWGKFKKRKPKSLVHKSFEMDPYFDVGDGVVITKMAMDCVGMGSPSDLVEYTYETLDSLTGGFSAENYIGSTQYGEVFRGKIHEGMETREVVVKRWVKPSNVKTWPRFSARLEAEIKLLTDSVLCRHPNMVKLNGYCCENGRFGVVYDLKPLDTVHNLVLQDDFRWLGRIKAFSPRLVDFGLLVGGVFGGIPPSECEWGCVGYADPRLLESVCSTDTTND